MELRRPSPPGPVQGTLSTQCEGPISPRPAQKTVPEKEKRRQHLRCPQGQPGPFPPEASKLPFSTISPLVENQESMIFSKEETVTLRPFESQDCGMALLERIQPTHFTELDTGAQKGRTGPRSHSWSWQSQDRSTGLPAASGAPASGPLSPKASASAPLG